MSDSEVAQEILRCTSDRDVLGLSQSGPLTCEGIQKAFHTRALHIHPDKAVADAPSSVESSAVVGAAFVKLVDARNRLRELLPLSQLLWQQQREQQCQQGLSTPSSEFYSDGGDAILRPSTTAALFTEANTAGQPTVSRICAHQPEVQPLSFSSAKCYTFGCLRTLTAEDVRTNEHICVYCRTKPRKCAAFGCLRMVTNAFYCSEHRS